MELNAAWRILCFLVIILTVICSQTQAVSFLDIHIRSEGCNDTRVTPGTRGIAYIKVNGKDYSPHGRGHNVVIVDAKTGAVLGSKSFDTSNISSAGVALRNYLNAINGDKIVLVAIQEEGSAYVKSAINAFRRLGAVGRIMRAYRGSFALVGYAHSSKPSWIAQEQQKRYEGPSEIFLRITLRQSRQAPSLLNVELRSEGCDDPGKTGGCGTAFITVNNQDYSLHKRGLNVAVFTEQGLFVETRAFDTYGVVKAGTSAANYLNRISGNKIVLVAVQDSPTKYGFATILIGALKRLGAREPVILEHRSSFALAGFAGSMFPSWVSQAQNKRYKGPSVLLVTIEGGCSCFLPLGLESGHLPNSSLSASSTYDANHAPHLGRLNAVPRKGGVGAWCARANNSSQWLQVNFGQETTVSKVATQGSHDGNHRVMSYSLSYSVDGSHWASYRLSDGQVKVFGGNVDRNTPVYHLLYPRVQAKYVRFRPRTWHGHICMRAELYGCNVHQCLMSLGLEDGRIKDGAMSASSSACDAKFGRLNLVARSGVVGAWCVKTRDAYQWLQIDLGKGTTVTKVATQGRQDKDQWVTKYSISYSPARTHWVYVMTHGKKTMFAGNFDRNSVVTHEILPPFHAYLVKIHPVSYYGWMSMRVELYGCPIKGIKE
ncbi:hypothetical protein ACROYT_G016164 [Oculina patagonica]